MRSIAFLAATALAVASPASRATAGEALDLPDWMTGCWVEDRGGPWTEECWMAPRAGMMLGASRSGVGEELREWEMLHIQLVTANAAGTSPAMVYRAAPQGGSGGWVTFASRPDSAPGLTFVNPGHDYPQRIRYWREGRQLKAEIATLDGSRARLWTYDPARR